MATGTHFILLQSKESAKSPTMDFMEISLDLLAVASRCVHGTQIGGMDSMDVTLLHLRLAGKTQRTQSTGIFFKYEQ